MMNNNNDDDEMIVLDPKATFADIKTRTMSDKKIIATTACLKKLVQKGLSTSNTTGRFPSMLSRTILLQ
jgi:hypothetical protein